MEDWYDPEGADTYVSAQVLLADAHAEPMLYQTSEQQFFLPTSLSFLPPHSSPAGTGYQGESVSSLAQVSLTSSQAFRDYPQQVDGLVPSPFASPALSHHRGSSFGSVGSPPSLFSSQQGPGAQPQPWYQADFGDLQRMQSITLNDGQQHLQPNQMMPSPAQSLFALASHFDRNVSSSSQYSHRSNFSEQGPSVSSSFPDGSLEQLIAQHQQVQAIQNQHQSAYQQFNRLPSQSPSSGPGLDDSHQTSQQMKGLPQYNLKSAEQHNVPLGSEVSFEQMLQTLDSVPSHLYASISSVANSSGSSQQAMLNVNFAGGDANLECEPSPLPWPLSASDQLSHQGPISGSSSSALLEPRPWPPQIAVRKPTRENSIDKLKKFLKLDVDMAYNGPQDDSPTTCFMRKRSASDAGPTAALMLNGPEFIKGDAKSPASPETYGHSDLSKLARGLVEGLDGSAVVMAMGSNDMNAPWLPPPQSAQHSAQQQQNTMMMPTIAPSGMASRDATLQSAVNGDMGGSSAGTSTYHRQGFPFTGPDAGGVGPMRSGGVANAAREAGAGSPYHGMRAVSAGSRQSSTQSHLGNIGEGQASRHDFLSRDAVARGLPAWSFPGNTPSSPGSVRRSQSTCENSRGSVFHRRTAQSEDLSRATFGTDTFKHLITAPDGSLMPPRHVVPLGGSPSLLLSTTTHIYPSSPDGQARQEHQRTQSLRASSHDQTGSLDASPRVGRAQQQMQQDQSQCPPTLGGSPPTLSNASPSGASPVVGAVFTGFASSLSNASSSTTCSQTALPTYISLAPRQRRIASSSSAGAGAGIVSATMLVNPPIQNVTTSATQAASASRRKNDAQFVCPVPGCGSQFTRQFNLRSHLRSHADERPFKCPAPGCDKAFARAHDAKRHHETLHLSVKKHVCDHCQRQFARLDALHRHLKPESGGCAEKAASSLGEGDEDGDPAPGGQSESEDELSERAEAGGGGRDDRGSGGVGIGGLIL